MIGISGKLQFTVQRGQVSAYRLHKQLHAPRRQSKSQPSIVCWIGRFQSQLGLVHTAPKRVLHAPVKDRTHALPGLSQTFFPVIRLLCTKSHTKAAMLFPLIRRLRAPQGPHVLRSLAYAV